ncbi:prosolanapyrone-II oxidase [Microdochium nivale]|nr:prosolanapyrone-II oxidase [Microdochium nivale]
MSSFAQVAAVYDDYINSRSGGEDTEHLAVGLVSYYVPFLGAPSLRLNLISSRGAEEGAWVRNDTATQQPQVQVQQLPGAFSRFPELPLSGLAESRGTMATFAAGTPTPKLRYDLRTLSFHSSVEMLKGMKQIFEEEIFPVQVADPSFSGITEWQLITEHAIRQGIERGGNMLGLDSGSGPLIIFAMANSWADVSGDEAAHAAARRVVERGKALAQKLGVYNPFLYANYAADGQNVLASYGEKNVARLRQVRRKYDCNNALSTLIPGGLSGM